MASQHLPVRLLRRWIACSCWSQLNNSTSSKLQPLHWRKGKCWPANLAKGSFRSLSACLRSTRAILQSKRTLLCSHVSAFEEVGSGVQSKCDIQFAIMIDKKILSSEAVGAWSPQGEARLGRGVGWLRGGGKNGFPDVVAHRSFSLHGPRANSMSSLLKHMLFEYIATTRAERPHRRVTIHMMDLAHPPWQWLRQLRHIFEPFPSALWPPLPHNSPHCQSCFTWIEPTLKPFHKGCGCLAFVDAFQNEVLVLNLRG